MEETNSMSISHMNISDPSVETARSRTCSSANSEKSHKDEFEISAQKLPANATRVLLMTTGDRY